MDDRNAVNVSPQNIDPINFVICVHFAGSMRLDNITDINFEKFNELRTIVVLG